MGSTETFEQFVARHDFRHFSAQELLVKTNAVHGGVRNAPPPRELWEHIVPTVQVLDELRERLGKPIILHSTYRSPAYNRAVGGARASQHLQFRAIDFHVSGVSPKRAAAELKKMRDAGFFKGGIGLYPTFVHVDTRGNNASW